MRLLIHELAALRMQEAERSAQRHEALHRAALADADADLAPRDRRLLLRPQHAR